MLSVRFRRRHNDFFLSRRNRLRWTLRIYDKERIGLGNVPDDLSVILIQGHGYGIQSLQNFYTVDEFRWKLIFGDFFFKILEFFSMPNTLCIGNMSGIVGLIDAKRKGSASNGYWENYLNLTSLMTMTLDCSRSNFEIITSVTVSLIDMKQEGSELNGYWADFETLPKESFTLYIHNCVWFFCIYTYVYFYYRVLFWNQYMVWPRNCVVVNTVTRGGSSVPLSR